MLWSLLGFGGVSVAAPGFPGLRLPDPLPRPASYTINLTLDPDAATFSGVESIGYALRKPTRSVWLNSKGLTIQATILEVSGKPPAPANWQQLDEDWIRVTFPSAERQFSVGITWQGPVDRVETQGVFSQLEGGDHYLFSQFEAMDARRAFPCLDQPDVKAPLTLSLQIPDALSGFANAAEIGLDDQAGPTKILHFGPTRPLPTYLFAFAVGPFETVDAGVAGRGKAPVRIVVPRGRAAWAGWAAESTPPLLTLLEDYFDEAYPFGKLDVVSLPLAVGWDAMENPGMITCVQSLTVSRPEDDTLSRQRDYAETITHEMAHQWFGDLVTPAWWDDLWLNESFASWLETKISEAWQPDWHEDVGRVGGRDYAMRVDSLTSARRIRQPIAKAEDVESAFDGITYAKGEAVLTMLEHWLGADVFRTGVRAFVRSHADGVATAEDFIAAESEAAGMDLHAVFHSFLDQPGVPIVHFAAVTAATPTLELTQSRYLPAGSGGSRAQRWSVPVCARWDDAGGSHHACTLLDRPKQSWTLPGGTGALASWVPDDGATGYFRTGAGESVITSLLSPESSLTRPERIAAVTNASALADRGDLPRSVVLAALPELLALHDPKLLETSLRVVAALDANLVPDELRPNYERVIHLYFGEQAEDLGLSGKIGESRDTVLSRPPVLEIVGLVARDANIVQAATPLAMQWLHDRSGVDAEMISTVLAISAADGNRDLLDRMHTEAKTETDRDRRELILGAMGQFRDPALTEAALDIAISGEFDIREAFGLLFGPLAHSDTREVEWRWVQAHIDPLVASLPGIARGYIPYIGSGFCDRQHQDEVRDFFRVRAKKWIGGEHALEQVLESIDLCVANVQTQAPAVRAFLARY